MRMCDKEVSLQHGLDAFHRHRLSIRSGIIDSLPHSSIEWHPGISILRKAEARKLDVYKRQIRKRLRKALVFKYDSLNQNVL